MTMPHLLGLLLAISMTAAEGTAPSHPIAPRMVHLRSSTVREWSEFPEAAEASQLDVTFSAKQNAAEFALLLRQQDVKQQWQVSLNGKKLGELTRDENDMVVAFVVPAGTLVDGENSLRIEPRSPTAATSDDIRVGQVVLHHLPLREVLSEATLDINVVDTDTQRPLPCRITIVNSDGALQMLGIASSEELAVRPGIVYSSRGRAQLRLPAGRYTIYAGCGFEYSLAQTQVAVAAGEAITQSLAIRREVPTPGYVACDTHVHTLTHSGHGDATIDERMITLAGEGIELPIATDHNVHIDYEPIAQRLGVRQHFTPVMGNEVTTPRGHFNIFPIRVEAKPPDFKLTDWQTLFDSIDRTPGVKVAILNHARDLHSGIRPFGPNLHNAVVGENLDGWAMRFNAMEVLNSSATQTDILQLFYDWMAQLNRGRSITPVGSSDSHDVGRHFVGQGRTYIRCDDRDVGHLDVDQAVNNFLHGRVMVSYGLLAEITVNEKYGSGELARTPDDTVQVDVRVLGPHWVRAERVMLFANGQLIREVSGTLRNVPDTFSANGVKWTGSWKLPKPAHDMHLVAIALGEGVDGLYWKTAKPYQPVSPEWEPHTLGCSGAVWLDVDADGRRTSARDYAERLFAGSRTDFAALVKGLATYDAAVAAQAAHLFRSSGGSLTSEDSRTILRDAAPAVQAGVRAYLEASRENNRARTER